MPSQKAKQYFSQWCRTFFHRDAHDKLLGLVDQGVPAQAVQAVANALMEMAKSDLVAQLQERKSELQADIDELQAADGGQ